MTTRDKALRIARIASDKKAQDIVVLDLRKLTNICDFFVIMSCESDRKARTISEVIEEDLVKSGIKPKSVEGLAEANWVVLDYLDIIVHIFQQERREFYKLEKLWHDARRIRLTKRKSPKLKTTRKPKSK